MPTSFNTYVEPFVGGGALFFTLMHNLPDKKYHINDLNQYLINFYIHLRDDYKKLADSLSVHKNNKEYYLSLRDIINQDKNPISLEKASVFYFVNKTSFSGKWQVNKYGEMTTGYANYPNSRYRTWSEIKPMYNKLMQGTIITNKDFEEVLEVYQEDENAFIFLDPPYTELKAMYIDDFDYNSVFDGILNHLKNSKAKILMILGDGDLEREMFSEFISDEYNHSYELYGRASNNIRNHLVIKNY